MRNEAARILIYLASLNHSHFEVGDAACYHSRNWGHTRFYKLVAFALMPLPISI
jgi:hypothetical protein